MLDVAGTIRDLAAVVADLRPTAIGPDGLYRLREIDPNSRPRVEGDPRIGAPLSGIGKIFAIGLNYSDHAAETNNPIPKYPIVFMKPVTSPTRSSGPAVFPKMSQKPDRAMELCVFISPSSQYVVEAVALPNVSLFFHLSPPY